MKKAIIISLLLFVSYTVIAEDESVSITFNEKFNLFLPNIVEISATVPLDRIIDFNDSGVLFHCWYSADSYYAVPQNYWEAALSVEYLLIHSDFFNIGVEAGGGVAVDKGTVLLPWTLSTSFEVLPDSFIGVNFPIRTYLYSNGLIFDINGYAEFRLKEFGLLFQVGANLLAFITSAQNVNGKTINYSISNFGYGLYLGMGVEF